MQTECLMDFENSTLLASYESFISFLLRSACPSLFLSFILYVFSVFSVFFLTDSRSPSLLSVFLCFFRSCESSFLSASSFLPSLLPAFLSFFRSFIRAFSFFLSAVLHFFLSDVLFSPSSLQSNQNHKKHTNHFKKYQKINDTNTVPEQGHQQLPARKTWHGAIVEHSLRSGIVRPLDCFM